MKDKDNENQDYKEVRIVSLKECIVTYRVKSGTELILTPADDVKDEDEFIIEPGAVFTASGGKSYRNLTLTYTATEKFEDLKRLLVKPSNDTQNSLPENVKEGIFNEQKCLIVDENTIYPVTSPVKLPILLMSYAAIEGENSKFHLANSSIENMLVSVEESNRLCELAGNISSSADY